MASIKDTYQTLTQYEFEQFCDSNGGLVAGLRSIQYSPLVLHADVGDECAVWNLFPSANVPLLWNNFVGFIICIAADGGSGGCVFCLSLSCVCVCVCVFVFCIFQLLGMHVSQEKKMSAFV